MDLEEDNKFNDYGWKSKILFSDGPEYANIIIIEDSNDFQVLISKTIEGELTTKCKVYIQDILYSIINIGVDENGDYLVILK